MLARTDHRTPASSRLNLNPRLNPNSRQAGFSLVEIVVALVIGMLGMIVIMQVFGVFGAQKRSTSGGNEAQNNGAIALYGLQRDIQQSGYGIGDLRLLGCSVALRAGVVLTNLAPLTIYPAGTVNPPIPAGDANTDTLLVVYGNSNSSVLGEEIRGGGGTAYTMETPFGFAVNDRVIAHAKARGGACIGVNALTLDTVNGAAGASITVASGGGLITNQLFNLGPAPVVRAYAIRGGNLTVCDYMVSNCGSAADAAPPVNPTVWVPIASNIVSLRAQYGNDTTLVGGRAARPNTVDIYSLVSTAPAGARDGSVECGWARIPAVRIVLVARSEQFEKTNVTGPGVGTAPTPTWAGSFARPAGSAITPINLSLDPNWQRFRYKVFETTIPIKNIGWMPDAPTTC